MKPLSKASNRRFVLASIGALFWVVLVLGLYYWIHKPITPALARAVGGALLDIGVSTVFVLVAGGLGRKVLAAILPDITFWSAAERTAAAAVVGLSLLSLALILLGAVVLTTASVMVLLVGVSIVSGRAILYWVGDLHRVLAGGLPANRWDRFLAATVLVLVCITLLLAVMPPTKWDVLTYHLAGAQEYVQQGRFYAVPHNHFLGFPQLIDTLFAGHLALTGHLAGAAVIHWWIGVLMLLAAGGYVARRVSYSAGWLTAAALITAPSLWGEMTAAYVDLMPIALVVIALSMVEQWRVAQADGNEVAWRYLVVIGALAGFGLGVKYSVLWLAVGLGVLILWVSRRDGIRRMVICGTIYTAAALLIFAPWLVRNFAWYGNPVYPFVFDSSEMNEIRQAWYSQPESGLIYSAKTLWQIPVLPFTATFLGLEGGGSYGADIGPLFMMLIPLLLLVWRQFDQRLRSTVTYAGVVAGMVMLAWWVNASVGSYISLQTRLVFYMFGPLALIVGIVFESLQRLPKKPFDLYFVLRALIGLTFVFCLIDAVRYLNNSGVNRYFSGKTNYEEQYLEDALGWHYETMRQINTLPPDTTVRFLWEPRYLYCDGERLNCYTDSLMDAWYYARRSIGDGTPAEIASQWRADGADYFLVYEFGRDFEQENSSLYDDADWDAWQTFADEYLTEVWHNGNSPDETLYILYRWQE